MDMASSDKRPSVKGRKKAQAPFAREGKADAPDRDDAACESGAEDMPGKGGAAEEGLQPVVSDTAASVDGVPSPPSFKLISSRGKRPATPVVSASDSDWLAPDASGVSGAAPCPISPPRGGSGLAVLPEQPSDFFDLGDLDDGGASSCESARRLPAIPLAGRKPSRAQDGRGSHDDVFAEASPRVEASSSEGQPEQSADLRGRSTSRKATEREKAIVRGRKRKIVFAAIVSTCIIAIAVSGLLFWNAYLRYDDASDIQGEWQVADGSMTVVIDGDSIDMPESLSYAYALDTWKKEISFSFEDLKGGGSYRFTSDRKGLVIRENAGDGASALTLVKLSDDVSAAPRLGDARTQEAPSEDAASDAGDGQEVDGDA